MRIDFHPRFMSNLDDSGTLSCLEWKTLSCTDILIIASINSEELPLLFLSSSPSSPLFSFHFPLPAALASSFGCGARRHRSLKKFCPRRLIVSAIPCP